jgi:hypothetical protein
VTTCYVRGCDAEAVVNWRWPTSVGYRLYAVCAPHEEWLNAHPDAVTTGPNADRSDRELVLADAE